MRPSKRSRWRALSLIAVHLLIVAHVTHWLVTGKTVTPVEPSEAMQTLELGYVNAGFLLFAALILATLVLGRFFCGWACHVVAYQDLCGWILRKLRMKPKPFRSRLLVWVPLLAALYMFVWPQVLRIYEGRPFPPLVWHLQTTAFWDTFPGLWTSLLTFAVCGGLIVYFLGNKGFCTYGCPYGGFFYHADRTAVGKIRVTDACDGCGHCTATCTSNVRVHEEVRDYGMVVDPGCMKCMDCMSVCPKNALYYGFGRPSLGVKPIAIEPARPKRKYDFTWPEELALAGAFVLAFYAYRGLYGAIPFLLSLGAAAITAYLLLKLARVLYARQVRVQRSQLRAGGRTTLAGWGAVAIGALLAALVVHSAVWQFHWHEGNRMFESAQGIDESAGHERAEEFRAAASGALDAYRVSHAIGLYPVAALEARMGSLYAALREYPNAESHLRNAVRLDPSRATARYDLARARAHQGKFVEAATQLERALDLDDSLPGLKRDYALALGSAGRTLEAVKRLGDLLATSPDDHEARVQYAVSLSEAGVHERALQQIRIAADRLPRYPDIRLAEAEIAMRAGRRDEASKALSEARRLDPYNPSLLAAWASLLAKMGLLESTLMAEIRKPADDLAAWYGVVFLYREKGETDEASALLNRLRVRHPELPVPQ